MIHPTHSATVRALFELGHQDTPADLVTLADRLDLTCSRMARTLDELERAGLVDADRVRLTMSGLALAVIARPLGRARRRAA